MDEYKEELKESKRLLLKAHERQRFLLERIERYQSLRNSSQKDQQIDVLQAEISHLKKKRKRA
jgi:DICT domain-containing protein